MAQVINTNLASLAVQRNLNAKSGAAQPAMERLSTGLRINSARDDAAGLSISSRMTSQINGLNVAARNAADGISLTQTAEGALGEVASNLQRMRDLAVQSSNATNTQADRDALQLEFDALRSEINRISQTANFNGDKLLDGTFTSGVFQVGADAGQTVDIGSISNFASASLGSANTATVSAATSGITNAGLAQVNANTITINGDDIGQLDAAATVNERVGEFVSAVNAISGSTNVSAFHDTANNQIVLTVGKHRNCWCNGSHRWSCCRYYQHYEHHRPQQH